MVALLVAPAVVGDCVATGDRGHMWPFTDYRFKSQIQALGKEPVERSDLLFDELAPPSERRELLHRTHDLESEIVRYHLLENPRISVVEVLEKFTSPLTLFLYVQNGILLDNSRTMPDGVFQIVEIQGGATAIMRAENKTKPIIRSNWKPLRCILCTLLLCIAALQALPGSAPAQLYVTEPGINTIGEYNATTRAAINPSFITGLNLPTGLVLSGSHFLVSNFNSNTVGEYDATTGALIDFSFITALDGPKTSQYGNALISSNQFIESCKR